MEKKCTPLELAQKQVEEAIASVNSNIEKLGMSSGKMHEALIDIQRSFDLIRGIPSEMALKYDEIKKLSFSWKQQVEQIEKEYDEFLTKNAMAGAGGGALGVGIVVLGPTVAMGVATTFGVASTGTAIATLSGAAATNAALAWLGGGALIAGGGGMAAGQAFLALAGPIGWAISIASITAFGILFFKGLSEKKRLEEIFTLVTKRELKTYKLAETEIREKINTIISETSQLIDANQEIKSFGIDYKSMNENQQYRLGVFVNLMLAATQNLIRPINALTPKFSLDNLAADYSALLCYPQSQMPENHKKIVINLANFFHSVDLSEKDIDILYNSLKKNDKFIESSGLKKNEFKKDFISLACELDKIKYPRKTA